VLRRIANPAGVQHGSWEQPIWCNFVWFTEIVPIAIRTIRVDVREYGEVEVLEREVIFRLAGDDVVIITLQGERPAPTDAWPTPTIAWAVRRARYRLSWHLGHNDDRWAGATQVFKTN
jgi:hypothetical protein